MASNSENEKTTIREVSFSQRTFILSFIVLYLGIIFVFGQSSLLGFQYLSTFEYTDFLLSSTLLIPLFLSILFVVTAFSIFILEPWHSFSEAQKALGADKWFKNKQTVNSLFDFVNYVSYPLFLIIWLFWFREHFIISLLSYLFLRVLMRLAQHLWTRNLIIETNGNKSTKDSLAESLNATISFLATTSAGWVFMTLLVFSVGQANIALQNKKKTDAQIYFSKSIPSVNVNILASNSNVLAIYVDDTIQLIPRSQIIKIEYKYKNISIFDLK